MSNTSGTGTNLNLIGTGWQSYRDHIMQPGCPEVQYDECRQAFYAGATTLLQVIKVMTEHSGEATQADVIIMNDINEELAEYLVGLIAIRLVQDILGDNA